MFTQISPYVFLLLLLVGVNAQSPEVEIPQGRLSGDTRTNRDGGTFYAFKNIPFGKSTAGELRFKAPVAADGWEGTRDATGEVPSCQTDEDCLYLNVYTPGLPEENISDLPVMVWIYGGGFEGGSGSERMYGGEYLLTKDVILVAINYRVGMLGFLSLDDPNLGVTGNAGMKDQVLALQWVQDNIAYFGGDPNNVLIFGQSAGSMSTHLQVISPAARGLFQKAILQSGVALSDTTTPARRNNALAVAEYLGIQTDDYEAMVESLQNASLEDISAAQTALKEVYGHWITKPIVEIASSEPTFLEELPIDIIKAGEFNQVSFIIGFNNAEEMGTRTIDDFASYIPGDLQIEAGSEDEQIIADRIKQFYFGDEESTTENSAQAVALNTDISFGFPSFRSVSLHLETALNPIYFYIFSAETDINEGMGGSSSVAGAAHGDEVGYIFPGRNSDSIVEGSVEDLAIKRMINMWTNFAIYGNPTPDSSEGFVWEPAQLDEFNYASIETEETVPSVDPNKENFAFWTELYADYFPDTNQGAN